MTNDTGKVAPKGAGKTTGKIVGDELKSTGRSLGVGGTGGLIVALITILSGALQPDREAEKQWRETMEEQVKEMRSDLKDAANDRFTGKEGLVLQTQVRSNETELARRGVIIESLREQVRSNKEDNESLRRRVETLEKSRD